MDCNGIDGESMATGSGSDGIPMGFAMNLMMNDGAMQGYAGLTEAEKENLLMRCRDAKSKGEMQRIVDDLAPGTDVRAIMDEEREGRFF